MIKDGKIQEMEQEINKRKNKLANLYKVLDQTRKEIEGEKLIIEDLEARVEYAHKINEYKENLDRLEYERDENLYIELNKGLYTIDEYVLSSYNIVTESDLAYDTVDSNELMEEINDSINSYYANYLDDEDAKNTFINMSIYIDGFYISKDKFIETAKESWAYPWLYDLPVEKSYSKEELLSTIKPNDFFNNTVKINPAIDIYKKYTENTIDRIGTLNLKPKTVNWNEFARLLKESNWRIDYDIKERTNNEFANLIESKKTLFSPEVNAILDNPTLIKDKHKEKKITL